MNQSEHSDSEECNSVSLETPSRLLNLPNLEHAKHKRSSSFPGPIRSKPHNQREFNPTEEKIVLEDTLIKTNPYTCRKSKRYFVLTHQRLIYFTNEKSYKSKQPFKGSYSLENTTFDWSSSSISVMSFTLTTTNKSQKTRKRRIIFNSEQKGKEWLDEINKLKKYTVKRAKTLSLERPKTEEPQKKPIVPVTDVYQDEDGLKSIVQESKEESSPSPEPVRRRLLDQSPSDAVPKKAKDIISKVTSEGEDQERKTPNFMQKDGFIEEEKMPDVEIYSNSHSRNKWSPSHKIESFPLEISNIQENRDTFSDGTESLNYLALHTTIEREGKEQGNQNIMDFGYEGISELPQDSPSCKIFEFLSMLHKYQLRISKEDLHSIVTSLKKSSSRNGLASGIHSLRSSLEIMHEKNKDPTQASTRRGQEQELIHMEDGIVLTVEQNATTRDKTLKLLKGPRRSKDSGTHFSSLDQVAEDEEQVIEWRDYLQNLLELGNDILVVHYSEKMLERIIDACIHDPEANKLNTNGPHCIFSRMQENLRCVNNYNNRETNDVLWTNMQILLRLTNTQASLARRVIQISLNYFEKAKKCDLEAKEYHLAGLIVNDMDITTHMLENYVDTFLRLRSDSGNYSFLHSFFEKYFCSKYADQFNPEEIHLQARKWIGGIIFGPRMVEFLYECINEELAEYHILQKKLIYLRLICEKKVKELVPVLDMSFTSVDALIAEAEQRFQRKRMARK